MPVSGLLMRRFRGAGLFLAALLALALFAPRAEAFIYWAEARSNAIGRANLDGTVVNSSFIPATYPRGVAVDDAHIYWASGDTIGRANVDSTGIDQSFIVGAGWPAGIALNVSHLYWANTLDAPGPSFGTIGRADLEGAAVDQSFITGDPTNPHTDLLTDPRGPAVDDAHLYWANMGFGTIGRANLDGTGIDQTFIRLRSSTPIVGEGTIPTGVAVDGNHIYWANLGESGSNGTIGRANLDGTGVDRNFIADIGTPIAVAVDDAHVYWANFETTAHAASIGRANLDGTEVNPSFIPVSAQAVAVDSGTPSSDFDFGEVDKNKRSGTAELTVAVPGPGELDLATTIKLRPDRETAEAAGEEQLSIQPKGKAKEKLNEKGKAKVTAYVTYMPTGGSPKTEEMTIRLVRR